MIRGACAVFGRLGAHSLGCASDPVLIPGTAWQGTLAIYRTMRRGSRGGRGRRVIDGDRGSAVVRPATVKGATCRQGGIRRRLCLSCPGPRRGAEGVSRRLGAPASGYNKRVSTYYYSHYYLILYYYFYYLIYINPCPAGGGAYSAPLSNIRYNLTNT